ncbi:hypothetical protein H2202_006214 [Exophiala xenobiotica]|nr:hypothetical protein H2202_006214 [Exophiala xenobiotica]KAK5217982.1 hypothetical protein LTR72_009153 [Exophiala xenobiotica]KAK5227805.1 hypothetical protein LTR47_008376 [Exophiala xenobiotica]KAK5253473.1 hypothetical protein LTS06_002184 [Exophiala xenobiotica]KAK5280999.1 hypothetical protein LTR40_005556 [Exophiala xenobiotica]
MTLKSHPTTPTLTIHHLRESQSERIIWLCEELGIPYNLKCYDRSPLLAPPELASLTPMRSAPVMTDTNPVTGQTFNMGESGAIAEYIINVHGQGRLSLPPTHPNYPDYLFWFHFANGSLLPSISPRMFLRMANPNLDSPIHAMAEARTAKALKAVEARLSQTRAWLAGDEFTAADIMNVFCLTTMRTFVMFRLSRYPNILAYLERVGARPKYEAAMAKGDWDLDYAQGLSARGYDMHDALFDMEEEFGVEFMSDLVRKWGGTSPEDQRYEQGLLSWGPTQIDRHGNIYDVHAPKQAVQDLI